eukprot:Nitzschia sp. Nitz4//scaffold15_size197535//12084//13209//NITZ4_001549-RA/size197535-augustus-gene-0.201-mRNA-1//1//CDS//3329537628//855//frame0
MSATEANKSPFQFLSNFSIVSSILGMAPGAVGGVCCVFIGHPIDLIKVRLQVGGGSSPAPQQSTFGMLRTVFVKEGIPGLYRGVQAPLLAVTPAFAVSFWSYDLASQAIVKYSNLQRTDQMSLPQIQLAGAASGIPLAAIIGPTERIKCLMQVNPSKYNGFGDCLQQVFREGGFKSVLKGTGATALRDVPGNAGYFGIYVWLKRVSCQLEDREKASALGTLIAGGCAGMANWVIAIPMDTIKSRWQTSVPGQYSGLRDVLQTLLREEGPKALFTGLKPALIRAFFANAACLFGVETVKTLIEGEQ